MEFIFKNATCDDDFKILFQKELYFKLRSHDISIDKHDPILNPFSFDEKVYEVENDSLECLLDAYTSMLLHTIYNEDDALEDAIFESTMANHG